jgi:hypothetical protein
LQDGGTTSLPDDTYTIYPTTKTSTAATYGNHALPTVSLDSNGLATNCDDSPTVTWWYKEAPDGNTWINHATTAHPYITDAPTTGVNADLRLTIETDQWIYGDAVDGKQVQQFRRRHVAANNATQILDWEFTITWINGCYNDAASAYDDATDIAYPAKNTYANGDRATGTSTASSPTWSLLYANCKQEWNLEIYDSTIPGWKTTGMNDTSEFSESTCDALDCTFATSYPWMAQSAYSGFTGHTNKQILVDIGGTVNSGGDTSTQIATYQSGPVTHQLRWYHISPRSYSSTAIVYDYF